MSYFTGGIIRWVFVALLCLFKDYGKRRKILYWSSILSAQPLWGFGVKVKINRQVEERYYILYISGYLIVLLVDSIVGLRVSKPDYYNKSHGFDYRIGTKIYVMDTCLASNLGIPVYIYNKYVFTKKMYQYIRSVVQYPQHKFHLNWVQIALYDNV